MPGSGMCRPLGGTGGQGSRHIRPTPRRDVLTVQEAMELLARDSPLPTGLPAGALRAPCTRSLQTLVPGPGGERCAYTAPSTAGALFPALSPADLPSSKSYDEQCHSAIRMARHQGATPVRVRQEWPPISN